MQPLFLFKFLGVPFFSYTTLTGFGIALALIAAATARGSRLDARTALSAALWVSAGALAAGRLVHIAYHADYFAEHPEQLLGVLDGGMAFVGVFSGGYLALWLWSRRRGIEFGAAADGAALPVALLASLAWLGAFLHGSQYGTPVDNAVALELRDIFGVIDVRWPTQLIAAAWSALVGLGLIMWQLLRIRKRATMPQRGSALIFLAAYGTGLFLLDFTRGDVSLLVAGLRLTQLMYLVWAAGVLLTIGRRVTSA